MKSISKKTFSLLAAGALVVGFGGTAFAAGGVDEACGGTLSSVAPGATATVDSTGNANLTAPTCSGSSGNDGADVWFEITGPLMDNMVYTVETTASGQSDTSLEVWAYDTATGDCMSLSSIGCNDDIGGGNFLSSVSFIGDSTLTYVVLVNEDWTQYAPGVTEGPIDVSVSAPGPLDDTSDCATTTLVLPEGAVGNISTALNNNDDNTSCSGSGPNDGADHWSTLGPTLADGNVYRFTTTGTGSTADDTSLEIFSYDTATGDCMSAVSVVCNDDIDTGGGNYLSEVQWAAAAGNTYVALNQTDWLQYGGAERDTIGISFINVTTDVDQWEDFAY